MVERKVSKEKYVIAFLVTFGIFALGLVLGLIIENERVGYVKFRDQEQKLDFNSLQLQYSFVDTFAQEENCGVLTKTFDDNIRRLERTRDRIENYQKEASISEDEIGFLKREYVLAQVNYWLLAQRTKKVCDVEFSTLLYFYSDDKKCPDCADQAFVLTYLKQQFGMNLLNFAFDGEYDREPLILLLKKVYDVKEYPTLVINGKPFSGFQSKEFILKEVCPAVGGALDVCSEFA